jgi:YidC/Oxa1 family membrane protein insertase
VRVSSQAPGDPAASTTSLAVGAGLKTFTTQSGLVYTSGARVRLSAQATGDPATSKTSLSIGTGMKTFTTQSGLAYAAGARVRAGANGAPSDYMEGVVASYSGASLVVNVDAVAGSGTYDAWNITPRDYMEGVVTSYGDTSMAVNVDTFGGSGTYALWNIAPKDYMEGVVTSYNGASLVVDVDAVAGSGTYALWKIDTGLEEKVNWSYYTQTADPDQLGVTYRFSDGHVSVKKVFRFRKNSYLSQVSTQILVDGKPLPHMIQWRGGFGDLTVPSPSASQNTVHYDVALAKPWWKRLFDPSAVGELVEQNATAASKGPIPNDGAFSFAGVTDAYFAAVFLPYLPSAEDAMMRQTVFTDTVRTPAELKPVPLAGMAISDSDSNQFRLFVGPKDVDLLKSIDPKLEQLVNFGWMSVVAKPLFLIVNWANDSIVHNFGWSIILVTIVINFALFPLKLSSMKSMRKMQALKPQIDAINARYKGISVRDPKKQEQTEETMGLYKKHGVNPMGGCLPMVIQLPILIAFYQVLRNSVEMRGASWLWVHDLSQPEHLPIKILPIVMIATQFLTQQMMPQPGVDPAQQKMTKFMPLLFGFFFYNFASGLVLYYLTSNLVGIAQQWFFNHTDTARAVALSVEPPARKKNGKK